MTQLTKIPTVSNFEPRWKIEMYGNNVLWRAELARRGKLM